MKTHRYRKGAVAVMATIGLMAVAACGGGGGEADVKADLHPEKLPATSLETLRTAWSYQEMTLDPATFYGGGGFSAMGALYEGLVQYAPGGVEIAPQLATSWTISDDGLTYRFTLRQDATFHDGTPVDAEAIRYSFQRFIDLKGAPSYMLADVVSMDAPDATTFVMRLAKPNNALLDYLASYVGPKAMSPTLLKANAGDDQGQTYLAHHDAGSGPYELTEVVIDKGVTLTAYPDYWGDAPTIPTVEISVVPDISQQVLLLEGGDLDLISSQVPPNLDKKMRGDASLSVTAYSSLVKPIVWVKDDGLFTDRDARLALAKAVDRAAIAKGAYGDEATPSKSLIPIAMIGGDDDSDDPGHDPEALKSVMEKAGNVAPIVIGYREGLARDGVAAELIQAQLQAAGLQASVRTYGPEFYGFASHPQDAPDLAVLGINSDAATPASWLSAYFRTGGGATLNGVSVPEGDQALDAAIAATDPAVAETEYEKAARAYAASGYFFTLADVKSIEYASTEVGPVAYTGGNPFGPMLALTGAKQ